MCLCIQEFNTSHLLDQVRYQVARLATPSQGVRLIAGPLTEGPGPTSRPGSLPAPRIACRCSPVGFDRQLDFIVGLPNTSLRHDSIWVIVDRLTKTAHFLPVHTTYNAKKYAEIYMDQIVHLHGVPKTIISDRGAQFIARFWEQLQHALGTKLIQSSTYHPQTDGQTERVNQVLEDMLKACVLQYDKNWDKCLSLAEF
jgi:hypothetical protein